MKARLASFDRLWRDFVLEVRTLKLDWRMASIILIAIVIGLLAGALFSVVKLGGARYEVQRDTTQEITEQLQALGWRVAVLEQENKALTQAESEARTQAQTSVDQLVRAGETPIVVSPDVVSTPAVQPTTSTTAAPPVIVVTPTPIPPPPVETTTTERSPPPTVESTTTVVETTTTTVADRTTTTEPVEGESP